MKLRLLQKKNIKACAIIVGQNYSKNWQRTSSAELKSMFSNTAIRPVYWVAEDERKIVGFAGYIQSWMDYNIYQIFWVNVLPELQKRGIGKQLVSKVINEIKKDKNAYLIQLTATTPNSKYYRKYFKFKNTGHFGPKTY